MDVRREEVRRTWPATAEPPPVPPLRTVPASTAWLVVPADQLANPPHPKCATHQVLLTLYATVAERYAGDDAGGEEEAGEGGTAQAAGAGAPTAAELEAATAFSASLAALAAQQEAAGQGGGTISQLAALAAQHAAVLQAMHETAQLAASVRVAAELQQRLADFDAAYAAGSYSEAAWIAVELQKGVAAVPGAQGLSMRSGRSQTGATWQSQQANCSPVRACSVFRTQSLLHSDVAVKHLFSMCLSAPQAARRRQQRWLPVPTRCSSNCWLACTAAGALIPPLACRPWQLPRRLRAWRLSSSSSSSSSSSRVTPLQRRPC